MTGPVIAGVLVLIWLNMAFTGDFDYDFDMEAIKKALIGEFSLQDLFFSDEGKRLLMLLVTGKVLNLGFPWLSDYSNGFKLAVSVLYTIGKDVLQDAGVVTADDPIDSSVVKKKLNETPESESVVVDHDEKVRLSRLIVKNPEPENIHDGLRFGDYMELISDITYEEEDLTHYGHPVINHTWKFNVLDTSFMDVLKYQYKKRHAGAWGGVRPNDGLDILYFEDQKMCKIKLEQWFE